MVARRSLESKAEGRADDGLQGNQWWTDGQIDSWSVLPPRSIWGLAISPTCGEVRRRFRAWSMGTFELHVSFILPRVGVRCAASLLCTRTVYWRHEGAGLFAIRLAFSEDGQREAEVFRWCLRLCCTERALDASKGSGEHRWCLEIVVSLPRGRCTTA